MCSYVADGRSLTHLIAAESAYKRVSPPLTNHYTATFGQFGWSLYQASLLL